ncbi:hypothetical protein [Vreelandella sp. EE22]
MPTSVPHGAETRPPPLPVNDYQRLVAMLLVPLASAVAVAGWTLYAMLAARPAYVLLPLASGLLLALPCGYWARRYSTCYLMLGLLAGLALALLLFGVAHKPWQFGLLGVGFGLGGGIIAIGAAHARRWLPGCWPCLAATLCVATLAGVGFSLRLVPLVVQAYGWRAAPLSLLVPLGMIMLLLWLFVEAPQVAQCSLSDGEG